MSAVNAWQVVPDTTTTADTPRFVLRPVLIGGRRPKPSSSDEVDGGES